MRLFPSFVAPSSDRPSIEDLYEALEDGSDDVANLATPADLLRPASDDDVPIGDAMAEIHLQHPRLPAVQLWGSMRP